MGFDRSTRALRRSALEVLMVEQVPSVQDKTNSLLGDLVKINRRMLEILEDKHKHKVTYIKGL